MIDAPLAYKWVALAVMLVEINFAANRLDLAGAVPIQTKDVSAAFIPNPRLVGVAGRIDTANYTFTFGASGRLRYIVKMRQREGMSLADYQEKLSHMTWTMGTNEALGIARKSLESIGVDVARLDHEHPSVVEQRRFYTQRNGKQQLVPLPLFDIKWGSHKTPVVAVVVSGVSGEVMSIRQEDDSYSRRPAELIQNVNILLAIPDSEFVKYTPEQRSNLVVEFAAIQYPPLSDQTKNAKHTDTNSSTQKKPMLTPLK